jgi:hypothetical protein
MGNLRREQGVKGQTREQTERTIKEDFNRGDPALHIIGKPEEQPARIHAPQPPKPPKTAKAILADIRLRMQELKPYADEYPALVEAHEALKGI